MCSAVSLKAVDVGDEPPAAVAIPEELSEEDLEVLAPFFRNAVWYYDAYFVYVKYAEELEGLNETQGQDIDVLLEENTKVKTGHGFLMGLTIVSTTAAIILALMIKVLL